jgi:hypothetical protein
MKLIYSVQDCVPTFVPVDVNRVFEQASVKI